MEKQGEIKKPLNLAIEDFKQDLNELLTKSRLPAYILEPIIKDLYMDCMKIREQEIQKAREEYEAAVAAGKAQIQ